MKPTDVLKHEHEAIKLMLVISEKIVKKLKTKNATTLDHFGNVLDFLKIFVDKCHHGKEEDLLFPEIISAGFPLKDGPIEIMLKEHNEGRKHIKNMKAAYLRCKNGSETAVEEISAYAKDYVGLMSQHIEKENNIVFNIADHYISSSNQKQLIKKFELLEIEKMGAGTHEKFHDMIYALKKIYLK